MHTSSKAECWGRQSVFPPQLSESPVWSTSPVVSPRSPSRPSINPRGTRPCHQIFRRRAQWHQVVRTTHSQPQMKLCNLFNILNIASLLEQRFSWVLGFINELAKIWNVYKCCMPTTRWWVQENLEQAALSVKCSVFSPMSTRKTCIFWVMLFLHRMLWN